MNKKNIRKIGIAFIYLIILVNGFLLFKLKQNSIAELPLKHLELTKPTLVVIVDEMECASCIHGLRFLNKMYTTIKNEGRLDFKGIILSKNNTDSKSISNAFIFPFQVSDDFRILKRLNLNRTPVIIGISKDNQILYWDLVPFQTGVTQDFIKKGVLDRLYYSLEF
jgi:hypothetical protein